MNRQAMINEAVEQTFREIPILYHDLTKHLRAGHTLESLMPEYLSFIRYCVVYRFQSLIMNAAPRRTECLT